MTFRWYGEKMDPIPLKYIRQIPGMTGVVSSLMDLPAGEVWPMDRVEEIHRQVTEAGLELEVIESVNVHEDIKLGLPTRDRYIRNYIDTIDHLGRIGIKVICYNFMPVFDWTRTNLAMELPDGSTTMCYEQSVIDGIRDPQSFADEIQKKTDGFEMAGWEPERMAELKSMFRAYEAVSHEDLFRNCTYFLEAIMPACRRNGIRMAMHPDDPAWDIFGLPRIANSIESFDRILNAVDDPCNSITLCTGSLGCSRSNDVAEAIRHFGKKDRIAFAHIRNLRFFEDRDGFYESSHLSSDGSFDMYEIVKAFVEVGFDGYVRPDHGRMIWDEKGRARYGLYDRALGATYLNGLWEAIEKAE